MSLRVFSRAKLTCTSVAVSREARIRMRGAAPLDKTAMCRPWGSVRTSHMLFLSLLPDCRRVTAVADWIAASLTRGEAPSTLKLHWSEAIAANDLRPTNRTAEAKSRNLSSCSLTCNKDVPLRRCLASPRPSTATTKTMMKAWPITSTSPSTQTTSISTWRPAWSRQVPNSKTQSNPKSQTLSSYLKQETVDQLFWTQDWARFTKTSLVLICIVAWDRYNPRRLQAFSNEVRSSAFCCSMALTARFSINYKRNRSKIVEGHNPSWTPISRYHL